MNKLMVLQQRKSLFWRLNFWAGMIASPFAVVAALTGILYIFTPQIESHMYGNLYIVAVAGERQSLDEVVPAFDASNSVRIYFAPMAERKEQADEHSEHQTGAAALLSLVMPLLAWSAMALGVIEGWLAWRSRGQARPT